MGLPYGSVVLEHFRRPRNQRSLERPTSSREGYNPLCGDRVRIELEVDGAVIRAAAFTANACALCMASASLLTERVQGASLDLAAQITDDEAVAALEADIPPGRILCAVLPARTLREAVLALRPPA
jgi:nitrogen fixation protein NifU and related proteins